MKVLVLGGSGFVSGGMVRTGRARGDEVWMVTRGKRAVAGGGEGVRVLTVDRNDVGGFEAAIAEAGVVWDLVIDCIGFNAEHARQDVAVFGEGRRAKWVVFLSSDFACSPVDRPWRIDETFDRFDTAPYGAGKRAAEEVLLGYRGASGGMGVTVLRPCHIYGPGSLLGCLPLHGRDAELLSRIRRGEELKLLAGGGFLQQPMVVEDLCAMAYGCAGNERARGELFFAAGPEIVESKRFYQVIGDILGMPVRIGEASMGEYLAANPEHRAFCCHRVYDRGKAERAGLPLPGTGLREGLGRHVAWLEGEGMGMQRR
ncbi:MAG TPA: NAD-dependent epimerase/dehydratase family protein [Phycisphaerae bacterium]|nr:NAD-dependent epimerase/dehydratase family protein [Phycisphaerae bacterium]